MKPDNIRVVHPVKLITGQDQQLITLIVHRMIQGGPNSVGRPLEPVLTRLCLLSCKYLHKPLGELIKSIGGHDVAMKTRGQKLCENKDTLNAGIDGVGKGDVYYSVFPAKTDGRLGPVECQEEKTSASASTQNHRRYPTHVYSRTHISPSGSSSWLAPWLFFTF
jgi:hypothetical protein